MTLSFLNLWEFDTVTIVCLGGLFTFIMREYAAEGSRPGISEHTPLPALPLIQECAELGGITGGLTPVLGIQGEILRFNQHDKRTKESHFAMLWVAGRGSGMGIKNLPALSECGHAAWRESQAANLPASNNRRPSDPGH